MLLFTEEFEMEPLALNAFLNDTSPEGELDQIVHDSMGN